MGWPDQERPVSAPMAITFGREGIPLPRAGFEEFFAAAMGGPRRSPFPYQQRLAHQDALPTVLCVPTGSSKTAAVIAAWLWRRRTDPERTPRRLVYTLPMRVLVEQTAEVARAMLRSLGLLYEGPADPSAAGVRVAVLMGGHVDEEWWLEPEREAILVGTVDMLLSRALNRGYALSRYRWPVDFGLLNSDALWVFDEVQLLGVGLYTSLQLQAMRRRLGSYGPAHTLWCSATVDPAALQTVDHPAPPSTEVLTLGSEDRRNDVLCRRLVAPKTVRRLASARARREGARPSDADIARAVLDAHRPGTRTLVVLNTVERAQRLYAELKSRAGKRPSTPEVGLLHSRFRPHDRAALQTRLLADVPPGEPGCIVVATQVIEAGVDVSAATLFTELAPWDSVVQRLGRCNRYGEFADGANVFWIDVPDREAAPYESQELARARSLLQGLEGADASPEALQSLRPEGARRAGVLVAHVLRRRDLVGLFDTTPDLSGQHLDVSRFIREGVDLDVLIYWREWDREQPPPRELPPPTRAELCSVPVYEARRFLEGPREGWTWDPLADSGRGGWTRIRPADLRPGQVILVRATDGGYSTESGWRRESRDPVPVVAEAGDRRAAAAAGSPQEAADGDEATTAPERWITLEEHTLDVIRELEALLSRLSDVGLSAAAARALKTAAAYHDVGKAHPEFQRPMVEAAPEGEREWRRRQVWAKAPSLGERQRRPFRHELASALALLQSPPEGQRDTEELDVAAFLVAAHHGKVRLAIRALPVESRPADGRRYALGVHDGDELGPIAVRDLVRLGRLRLDLSPMEMGLREANGRPTRSWTDRMAALRDAPDWGPFRLAFLEALLRVADIRASLREKSDGRRSKEGGVTG